MGHQTTSLQTSISGSYQQYRTSNHIYSRRYSRKWGHPHPWHLHNTAGRQFLSITVYCKPTHTDQYLQWDSHHSLSAKYSVIGTLTHRAKTVCTGPELLQGELQHLRKALVKCKYPHWAINRVQSEFLNSNQEDSSNNNLQDTHNNLTSNRYQQPQPEDNTNNSQANNNLNTSTERTTISIPKSTVGYVIIPYTQRLAESFKNICGKCGIQTYFKGNTTIKQVLMKPNDQDPKDKKVG